MVEADVVRPAGRPVLHVAQVGVSIDQHVSATEQRQQSEAELQCRRRELCHRSVPAVQRGAVTSHRERGQPPLELPEARGGRDVGAQQVAAVDVPDRRRRKQRSHTAKSGGGGVGGARKDTLTVCYTGPRCPCPSRSCLSPSLRCSTSRNRTCRPPSPLEGPRWKTRKTFSFASEPQTCETHVCPDRCGLTLSPNVFTLPVFGFAPSIKAATLWTDAQKYKLSL